MKAKLGPEHPNTLTCTLGLADAYNALGQFELAMPLYEQVLALEKAIHGPDYPGTLGTMNNLAVAYWQQKKLDKSIPLFEETLKVLQAKIGRDHPNTQMTVANLGVNYKDAGRLAEALPLLEEANRSAKRYASLGWVGEKLLDTYRLAGKTEEAAAARENATRRRSEQSSQGQPRTGRSARPNRSVPAPTEEMDRGRAAPPRVPHYPREAATRRLAELQHPIAARRSPAGPKEICRSRIALAEGLRGDESSGRTRSRRRAAFASPSPSTGSSISTPQRTSRTRSRSGRPSGRSIRRPPHRPGKSEGRSWIYRSNHVLGVFLKQLPRCLLTHLSKSFQLRYLVVVNL